MALKIVRRDITQMHVDAIINPTNRYLDGTAGVDGLIHKIGGPEFAAECKALKGCNFGEAKVTNAYNLHCKYIIHTVGPIWNEKTDNTKEKQLLEKCYENSVKAGLEHNCSSIACPLISSGHFGFPKKLAFEIAFNTINKYLEQNKLDIDIYLVVYDKESLNVVLHHKLYTVDNSLNVDDLDLTDEMIAEMDAYTDVNDVKSLSNINQLYETQINESHKKLMEICESLDSMMTNTIWLNGIYKGTDPLKDLRKYVNNVIKIKSDVDSALKESVKKSLDLIDKIEEIDLKYNTIKEDKSFSENLKKLVETKKIKPVKVYTAANQSKQNYSHIMHNKDYHPEKNTVISYALALKLNLNETQKLLKSAGYFLSNSIKFDLTIRQCIIEHEYDVKTVNAILKENHQHDLKGCK